MYSPASTFGLIERQKKPSPHSRFPGWRCGSEMLSVGVALACFLLPACLTPAWSATPPARVAISHFVPSDGDFYQLEAARQLSLLAEARLSADSPYLWVARSDWDTALTEIELGAAGITGVEETIRLGAWLGAEILVRGRLVYPAHMRSPESLEIELIELQRGELLKSTTAPLTGISEIAEQAATIAEKIEESLATVTRDPYRDAGRRIVAPLFFSNLSENPRLDVIEERFMGQLHEGAASRRDVRVLRFPRTVEAGHEAAITLLGLIDSQTGGRQRIADLFLWGSVEEMESDTDSFQDLDVRFIVHLWSPDFGYVSFGRLTRIADLETDMESLADLVLESEAAGPVPVFAEDALAAMSLSLWEQAESIRERLSEYGADRSYPGNQNLRRWWNHRLHLLDLAAFFDPGAREVQWERLRMRSQLIQGRQGSYHRISRPAIHLENLRAHLEHLDRFPAVEDPLSALERTHATIGSIANLLHYVNGIRHGSSASIPGDRGLPDASTAEFENLFAEWVKRGHGLIEQLEDPQRRSQIQRYYRPWLRMSFQFVRDSALIVEAAEMLWLPYREVNRGSYYGSPTEYFTGELEEMMERAYRQVGRSARWAELLETDRKNQREWDRERDEFVRRTYERRRQLLAERTASAASVPARPTVSEPRENASASEAPLPEIPYRVQEHSIWPDEITRSTFLGMTARGIMPRTIRAAAWHDGYLFLSEESWQPYLDSPPLPRRVAPFYWHLWRYDPATDTADLIYGGDTEELKTRTILPFNDRIWGALEFEGVLSIDPRSLAVEEYLPHDGLLSPHMFAIAAAGGDLYFGGGKGDDSALSRFHPGDRSWHDVPAESFERKLEMAEHQPPQTFWQRMNPFGRDPEPSPVPVVAHHPKEVLAMASWNDWLLIEAGGLFLYDARDKTWHDPYAGTPTSQRRETRNPQVLKGDPEGFWIGTERGLAFLRPERGTKESLMHFQPLGRVTAIEVDRDRLWVALEEESRQHGPYQVELLERRHRQGLRPTDYLFRAHQADLERPEVTETRIMLLNRPDMAPVAQFSISGEIREIIAAGNRLWLGLSQRANPLLELRIDESWFPHQPTEPAIGTAASPETALMRAAYYENFEAAERLLDSGTDINSATPQGWTALHAALRAGNGHMAAWLLDHGADPGALTVKGLFPLKMAARQNDLITAQRLLDAGADVNERGPAPESFEHNGQRYNRHAPRMHSALTVATHERNHEMVDLLVSRGADPNLPNARGTPPVIVAASGTGDWALVETLLQAGADPDARDLIGRSLLDLATAQGNDTWVRQWFRHSTAEGRDNSALLLDAASRGNASLVFWLLENGADLHAYDLDADESALSLALKNGHSEIVDFLLHDAGFDPVREIEHPHFDRRRMAGVSAFLRSLESESQIDITRVLLDRGSDPNRGHPSSSRHFPNNPPLVIAARHGNLEGVKLLLEFGADPLGFNNRREIALDKATHPELRSVLQRATDEAREHVRQRNREMLERAGRPVEGIDALCPDCGRSALHKAAEAGNLGQIKTLLAEGATIDSQERQLDATPIMLAVAGGHLEAVRALAESGADLRATNNRNATPLHYAAAVRHEELIRFLLDSGLEPEIEDEHGNTPFTLAAGYGNNTAISLFLEAGASDYRALSAARNRAHRSTTRLLEEAGIEVPMDPDHWSKALFFPGRDFGPAELKTLVERGADLRYERNSETVLFHYMSHDRLDLARTAVKLGADVNAIAEPGISRVWSVWTPPLVAAASLAVRHGHDREETWAEFIDFLIDRGAHIDAREEQEGRTALMVASYRGNIAAVKTLLLRGADPALRDKNGQTAAQLAGGRLIMPDFLKEEHRNRLEEVFRRFGIE